MNTDELLKTAQPYKVITFDVFDTLLFREVVKPTEVFELAGGKAFRYMRIAAEMLARKTSPEEDITLEEIYRFLPGHDPEEELDWERKVCYANPAVQEIYETLKRQGKKIYAVSDMYLSTDFVKELLEQNGYFVDAVYVSSAHRACKVTGKLYRRLCAEQGIAPEDILHIGDSETADVKGAEKAGIKAFHVPKDKKLLQYSKLTNENRRLCGYINHQLNEIDDRCERLGYEILGPIFVSFCQWLYEQKHSFGFEKLFFLARDARMPLDIYTAAYGAEGTEYLHISRSSLRNAADHPEFFLKYLESHGCRGNVAVVDTGWVGVIQVLTEFYAQKTDPSTELGGLYVGLSPAQEYIKTTDKNANCFFVTRKMKNAAMMYAALLEALIGQCEPRAVGYEENGTPIFDHHVREIKKIAMLQEGAKKFAGDWISRGNAPIDPHLAFRAYCRLFDDPRREDIEALGTAEFDDVEMACLVNFKGHMHYLRHPGEWFHDLQVSPWKGAFFKQCFPHLKALYKLYFVADSYLLNKKDQKRLKGKKPEELVRYY